MKFPLPSACIYRHDGPFQPPAIVSGWYEPQLKRIALGVGDEYSEALWMFGDYGKAGSHNQNRAGAAPPSSSFRDDSSPAAKLSDERIPTTM